MSLGAEFDLIGRYFGGPFAGLRGEALASGLSVGLGDDGAVLDPIPTGEQLVVAADMLVEGRHYFTEVDPSSLGHKCLAVNLSDLAAMGARPLGFTLSIGIREIRPDWLSAFSRGLLALAERTACPLLGGDTVRVGETAPEVFSISILGLVPSGQALRRSGLQVGDELWVSGTLGDGAQAVRQRRPWPRLNWPEPRLALGQRLRGLASAAIDISDGLSSELEHLRQQSSAALGQPLQCRVRLSALQGCLGELLREAQAHGHLSLSQALRLAAESGDEYEMLFGAPVGAHLAIDALSTELGLPLTCIGQVRALSAPHLPVLDWHDESGVSIAPDAIPGASFDHFRPA